MSTKQMACITYSTRALRKVLTATQMKRRPFHLTAHDQWYIRTCISKLTLYNAVSATVSRPLQVHHDHSDTYKSDSAKTQTLLGHKNCARRLKSVSITRIPLELGHFSGDGTVLVDWNVSR